MTADVQPHTEPADNQERTEELAAFRERGLLGLFSQQSTGQASPDYVGPGASLLFREGVEAFQRVGADPYGLHLSGRHKRILTHLSVLRYVSQWDTLST